MTVKFNSGNPVIICDDCRVVIRYITPMEANDTIFNAMGHRCLKCSMEKENERNNKKTSRVR